MKIKNINLNKEELLKVLSYLLRGKEELFEKYQPMIFQLLESSKNVYEFLRNVDGVDDEEIKRLCRRAAFAQMYAVKADYYYRGGTHSDDYISYCKGQIAVINKPHAEGCVVISNSGEVLIDEGILWLNGNGFYGPYVVTRQIIDGTISWVEGVMSNSGEEVFPFGLFDDIKLSLSMNSARFKSLEFSFNFYGNITNASDDFLMQCLESTEGDDWFISPDGVIFNLWCKGYPMSKLSNVPDGEEFIDNITPYRLSREIIQCELDKRSIESTSV